MPYAVTHILVPVILLSLMRDFWVKNKEKFPLHYVLIGGLAGVLPDLDIAVYYAASFFGATFDAVHRTFSHTLFAPALLLALGFLSYSFKNRKLGIHHIKLRNLFFVMAFGTLVHLLLDALVQGSVMPLYPLSYFSLGLNLIQYFPAGWQETIVPTADAALLVLWLIYLELKHKISDFI